ncbi:hypothetical protein [Thauera sp. SDU_THAU2]|uniref:hypothetical protein n=1 Tax=Thauera sp. SDU_THAU2 TaxID=3136633 RepID=UPI00311E77E0
METTQRQQTESRIRELRQAIEALEQELNKDDDAVKEHAMIDHLDQYIDAVDTKVSSLKAFWQSLKQEWKTR